MSRRATVLIPTMAGRGPTLQYALRSALAQTVQDLEVFVMGDGVDDATRKLIRHFQAEDARVRFFDHPKHERRGEPNRHAALQEATGRVVCYLCDRDLMLADHVEVVEKLLEKADFCHTFPLRILPGGAIQTFKAIDVSDADDRASMVAQWRPENGIPLSFAAHTLTAYRSLPHGWRTTPEGHYTDVYMWQQFLAQPEIRAVTGFRSTILYFPRYTRGELSITDKRDELARWWRFMQRPGFMSDYLAAVSECLARDQLRGARQLRRIADRIEELPEAVRNELDR